MAEYISTTAQTLTAGSAVILQSTAVRGGCGISHRDGTPAVAVRGSGCNCSPAKYKVFAHVTIAAPAATPVQVGLAVDGIVLPETVIAFPAVATGTILSGTTGTLVAAGFDSSRITIEALSDLTVNTALMIVEKTA